MALLPDSGTDITPPAVLNLKSYLDREQKCVISRIRQVFIRDFGFHGVCGLTEFVHGYQERAGSSHDTSCIKQNRRQSNSLSDFHTGGNAFISRSQFANQCGGFCSGSFRYKVFHSHSLVCLLGCIVGKGRQKSLVNISFKVFASISTVFT